MNPVLLCLVLSLPGADASDFDTEALARVNTYRKQAGLAAVKLDADLSKACAAHADYLVKNQEAAEKGKLDPHNEDPKLPGFSEAGRKAARASVIAQGTGSTPLYGLDLWMGSFFHRVPFLDPALTRIGVGHVQAGRSWAFVLDTKSGRDFAKAKDAVVVYPVDGQKDVGLLFSHGWPEFPNPIPDNQEPRKTGFPITASFFHAKTPTIQGVKSSLTDGDGKAVEHWLFSPEKPAVKGHGSNSICLLPKAPLRAHTSYTVQVTARVNGREWKQNWKFTTGEKE